MLTQRIIDLSHLYFSNCLLGVLLHLSLGRDGTLDCVHCLGRFLFDPPLVSLQSSLLAGLGGWLRIILCRSSSPHLRFRRDQSLRNEGSIAVVNTMKAEKLRVSPLGLLG